MVNYRHAGESVVYTTKTAPLKRATVVSCAVRSVGEALRSGSVLVLCELQRAQMSM